MPGTHRKPQMVTAKKATVGMATKKFAIDPYKVSRSKSIDKISRVPRGAKVRGIIETELKNLEDFNNGNCNISVEITYEDWKLQVELIINSFLACTLIVNLKLRVVSLTKEETISADSQFLTFYNNMYMLILDLPFESITSYNERIFREETIAREAEAIALEAEKNKFSEKCNGGFVAPYTQLTVFDKDNGLLFYRIDEVELGFILIGPNGEYQRVENIIRIPYAGTVYSYTGLVATPNFAICVDGKWIRIKNAPGAVQINGYEGFVYILVAVNESKICLSSFVASGVECLTIAHGYTDDVNYSSTDSFTALSDRFWGHLILKIIDSDNGQDLVDKNNGVLTLDGNYKFHRDPHTNRILSMRLFVKE